MGRNNSDFAGITYKHYSTHPTSYEIEAIHPKTGEPVGYLRYSKKDGLIQDISVDKEFRRKGIATGLFNHAVQLANTQGLPIPKHSPVRTPSGEAWTQSLGVPGQKKDNNG